MLSLFVSAAFGADRCSDRVLRGERLKAAVEEMSFEDTALEGHSDTVLEVLEIEDVPPGLVSEDDRFWVMLDGYNSASDYAPRLRKRGYKLLHVDADESSPGFFWGMNGDLYLERVYVKRSRDVRYLARGIEHLNIRAAIPGTDRAAGYADALNRGLGLAGNDPLTSEVRRDKIAMGELLEEVPQFASGHLDKLLEWASEMPYPYAMKVPRGVGQFGFHIVHSPLDIQNVLEKFLGEVDNVGNVVDKFLLQPYLRGTVMAFDTISYAGQHYTSEILRYRLKRIVVDGSRFSEINEYADIVDPRDPVVEPLIQYGTDILEKLGMHYNAAHTEIMDLGPGASPRFVLLEINPRLVGAGIPSLVEHCTGENPIDIHIDSIENPAKFLSERAGKHYQKWKPSRIVVLHSNKEGTIRKVINRDRVKGLPSHVGHRIKESGKLKVSTDLASSTGVVFLSHDDPRQIDVDTAILRDLRLYEMEED